LAERTVCPVKYSGAPMTPNNGFLMQDRSAAHWQID